MENRDTDAVPLGPMVPPVVDEAEFGSAEPEPEARAEGTGAGLRAELDTPLDTVEQQLLADDDDGNPRPQQHAGGGRPGLQRGNSVPSPAPLHLPPPAPAPPAPAPEAADPPTDSLSLMQLQSLVRSFPRLEPAPYAFTYDDASSLEDELEEWFSYSVEERAMLLKTHASFSREWSAFGAGGDWSGLAHAQQAAFVAGLLDGAKQPDPAARLRKLEALVYVLLGCWHESAGLPGPSVGDDSESHADPSSDPRPSAPFERSGLQVHWMRKNAQLFVDCGGLCIVVDAMRSSFTRACDAADVLPQAPRDGKDLEKRELWCAMTAVYVVLEVARVEEKEGTSPSPLSIRAAVLSLRKPGLFMMLAELIEKMRWDESIQVPLSKVFLLAWKTTLVGFGGLAEVERAKDSFRDESLQRSDQHGQPMITASPLDYHLFRQEISSKYPAYNAPAPIFPLEPENKSILPPLKNHPNKVAGNHVFGSGLGDMNGNNTSIFQQPVHIATPAPSPPPSPAGPGGKGGKKQNYQTNQLFPFLYPPLDETSNQLGGKGSTDLQDLLVGRKWEGPDIPSSILEAAELFSTRMRATRAMKQLWEERVQFMKYERGWSSTVDDLDVDDLSLEPNEGEAKKEPPEPGSIEERLDLVEECYRNALPHLQSLVIVMIKVILSHVTALVTQGNGSNGLQSGFQYQENENGHQGNAPYANGVNSPNGRAGTKEELDVMRTQEILDKAVCGMLILLLKWFKVSHILKFEYLTQLLVDACYVPLILKLLQLQEVEKVVNYKCEQEEFNFFHVCRAHSRLGISDEEKSRDAPKDSDAGSDSDDALPPPIHLYRASADGSDYPLDQEPIPLSEHDQRQEPPEVDELGVPLSELPKEPITNYSWRAFFTSINVLRIMQKICKHKAHRNLLLVSYKSSQYLKKSLKVPQETLRRYTLKLFKNQVPYCGRKWRQSNMRVITAVYLTLTPELRDDWLAGSDVDAEVDESVPLEQALRALTHWFNLKRYPEGMGARKRVLEEESDFFRRELEKMDWGEEGEGGDPGLYGFEGE